MPRCESGDERLVYAAAEVDTHRYVRIEAADHTVVKRRLRRGRALSPGHTFRPDPWELPIAPHRSLRADSNGHAMCGRQNTDALPDRVAGGNEVVTQVRRERRRVDIVPVPGLLQGHKR